MHVFELLGLHKPDEAVLEAMDYKPDMPFAFGRTAKETSPEVWADYFTLITIIVSGLMLVTVFLFGG
jgi:hypothetical protein